MKGVDQHLDRRVQRRALPSKRLARTIIFPLCVFKHRVLILRSTCLEYDTCIGLLRQCMNVMRMPKFVGATFDACLYLWQIRKRIRAPHYFYIKISCFYQRAFITVHQSID